MSVKTKIQYYSALSAVSLGTTLGLCRVARCQDILPGQSHSTSMMNRFVENYMGVEQLGTYLISLFVAIILAMAIAFHPQTFGKKEDINEIEAPKTLIFYAMIGSLVGATVADYGPELGFIFFGLGGLMRFRTNTGTSVQTGRLILVALIGLCCGLKMIYIAAISTMVGWALIYFLERKTLYQIEIKGISPKVFLESVAAYRQVLEQQGCNIIVEKKNPAKSKVSLIFSSPPKMGRDSLEESFMQQISEDLRGTVDWNAK